MHQGSNYSPDIRARAHVTTVAATRLPAIVAEGNGGTNAEN